MARHSADVKLVVALLWTSVALLEGTAFARSRAADAPGPSDLQSEVEALKAENAAVRELLRKMEEQQKAVLERLESLQRQLDGGTAGIAEPGAPSHLAEAGQPPATEAAVPEPAASAEIAGASQTSVEVSWIEDHYRDGIVIWENPEEAKVPLLLRFNNNTQIRFLDTTDSDTTFTDHLGNVRDVHTRKDVTVNRSMFVFAGYIFDPRLQYSLTTWTSAGAASIIVAGNIGWRFNQGFTLTGGYTGVPGSRSLVNTFPFFQPTDRSMADNFFRPGFTQGVWASGEPVKGLNYLVFVGNGLNTLNISATKIDTHLALSGSVWWEPLGAYSEPGKSRQMYDDYFASDKTRIRIGTSLTRSREDRFSSLDQSTPDNTSIYNSDGVLAFSTGAFAPDVTVQEALYEMWAIDAGLKKSGFSINAQYYFRRVSDFVADGPMPLDETFDHGFELSMGTFVVPQRLVLYVRGSQVFGEFADPYEYGGGMKWYLLPTERLWITAELLRVHGVPYSGAFTPYTAGLDGWVPMIQTVLAF